jgi:hypothetical protein
MKTQSQKHQHLNIHQDVTHENPPALKIHQTDPDTHPQKNQEHHRQPENHPHHQEDHVLNKEADPNNDDHNPRLLAPDHRPNNQKLNLRQHPKRSKYRKMATKRKPGKKIRQNKFEIVPNNNASK